MLRSINRSHNADEEDGEVAMEDARAEIGGTVGNGNPSEGVLPGDVEPAFRVGLPVSLEGIDITQDSILLGFSVQQLIFSLMQGKAGKPVAKAITTIAIQIRALNQLAKTLGYRSVGEHSKLPEERLQIIVAPYWNALAEAARLEYPPFPSGDPSDMAAKLPDFDAKLQHHWSEIARIACGGCHQAMELLTKVR